MHCTKLHYTTLHCTELHYSALECTDLPGAVQGMRMLEACVGCQGRKKKLLHFQVGARPDQAKTSAKILKLYSKHDKYGGFYQVVLGPPKSVAPK